MASLIKNERSTLERIEKFLSPLYFTDCNLYGKLYTERAELTLIRHFNTSEKHTFEDIVRSGNFSETKLGSSFGPTWSVHWFQIVITIPDTWTGKEVHLRWKTGCEGLLFNEDGIPLQGLNDEERDYYIISYSASPINLTYYIEMTCNTLFGAGKSSMISARDPACYYNLSVAEIALFDRKVYNLKTDLELLYDIAKYSSRDTARSFEALYSANNMINVLQINDFSPKSFDEAKQIGLKFFNQCNGDSQHIIHAVGNCHIDCAWLWPFSETIRKCGRSWSSVIQLMEKDKNMKFACSQAQQFQWVKEHYPLLFDKIKYFVSKGQFLPVGGTWVEMDGNLPNGEAFIRHFLYGQKFFKEEFDIHCRELWLPDTFGYSAQLPQIMKLCGINRFMSSKICWNLVNQFPHSSFKWEGIDGTQVLVHFPPFKTYTSKVNIEEILNGLKNLEDKGRVNCSLMLYGHGDGGGGPTEAMLERINRLNNVDGIPKIKHSTPDEFFESLILHENKLCKWVGELFLELHNATYTTQAKVKEMNRKCEFLLYEVEFFYSIAILINQLQIYPKVSLEKLWKLLLLNQFHDVLPGTSIKIVFDHANEYFNQIEKECCLLLDDVMKSLCPKRNSIVVGNSLSWKRTELIKLPKSKSNTLFQESQCITDDGKDYVLIPVTASSASIQSVKNFSTATDSVTVKQIQQKFILENKFLIAEINSNGNLVYLLHKSSQNNVISSGTVGNNFVIFDDVPLYWDAWDVMDYHLETKRSAIKELTEHVKIIEHGPLRVTLLYSAKVGMQSMLTQKIVMDAVHPYLLFETTINWHENHKFLKVEFPVNVQNDYATYEIQYGHLRRPTHYNTSWDWTKYEVYAHKWADLSEHNWGVALLNTNKYGYSIQRNLMTLSLLRSPKSPDDTADMGQHCITYAIMPHDKTFQQAEVIQQSYQLNCPLRVWYNNAEGIGDMPSEVSYFSIDTPSVIISAIKKAENEDNCLLVRLYESYGSRVNAMLTTLLPVTKVVICNGLEDFNLQESSYGTIQLSNQDNQNQIKLEFTPFQIISLLLYVNV